MKKFIFVLLLPLIIQAQNLNGRFSSSFYTFERFNSLSESEQFIRTYQTLSLNLNYGSVSLRTRTNFETNIGNSLDADPRFRFYNLYLEAREILDFASIKIGRQPLFTPVAGGLFDGVNLKLKYDGVSLSGFYGGNVPAYQKLEFTDKLSEDYVLGGKFEVNALDMFRIGASYIDKNFKAMDYEALRLNENFDPVSLLVLQKSNQYKYVTGEFGFNLPSLIRIDTKYEYDLNYDVTSKIEVDSRITATEDLGFNVYYNYREPRIRYNSIFSVFNYGNSQEIEGGIDYRIVKGYTLYGKFAHVSYKDDNSQRITVGANTDFGSVSYRKSLGYSGELDAATIYVAQSFMDGLLTPSLGLSYTVYKLSKNDSANNITSVLAGVNYRPFKLLSIDLQGQYFNNKIYQNDYRVLLKINYWFNTNF